jgi:hypothetical protein
LKAAEFAMDAPAAPQILITIAARFGRIFVEIQLDRLFTDSEGRRRVDPDALPDGDRHGAGRLRDRHQQYRSVREDDGIEFHVEGPVGQFALGRGAEPGSSV